VKALETFADSRAAADVAASNDAALTSRVRIGAWCLLPFAALIEAVAGRHTMQDDGINYLDMGDAILRGDWKMAVNGIWSPLYPFLQGLAQRLFKPSPYSQFTVVHFVNFLIFLFALASFEFFLRASVAHRPQREGFDNVARPLPDWAVFAVGYSVFLWSSVSLIGIQQVIPDMLMAGFIYLAAGLLLQIWAHPQSFLRFVLLGVILGIGYLAKAPVFPLAFVFFALAWLVAGKWRHATPRVLIAVLVFLAITAPWVLALSKAQGRLTFGDSARYNYVLHVNNAAPYQYFQDLGTATGHYKHTVRKIFDDPPIYEYATPLRGTAPIAYDPSYWSEGAIPRVYVKTQLSVIHRWLVYYLDLFFASQTSLFVGFVVLCFMAGRGLFLEQIAARWPVWLIGLTGLGMYTLVHAELRYIAVFLTLLWMGLFSGLEMPPSREGRRLASLVTVAVVVAMATPTALSAAGELKGLRGQPHNQWRVAEDLQKMGVRPGDRVARFPQHFGLAWARLLRVTVVAQIPLENQEDFWCAKPEKQAQVIEKFRGLGVTAVVAEEISPTEACAPAPEWQKVGDGTYYALRLKPDAVK
jgi:hypothetical protein